MLNIKLLKYIHILRSMQRGSRYFCDYCYTEKIDAEDEITNCYFSCYQKGDYMRHIKSKKHIETKKKITEKQEYKCKFCAKYFDKDGYDNHLKINKMFHEKWDVYPNIEYSCNNFIINEVRATCWEDWKEKAIKGRKTSTGYRPKCIRKNTRQHLEALEESAPKPIIKIQDANEESEDEYDYEPYDYCYEVDCLLPKYKYLNKERRAIIKNRGGDYCKCVYKDSDNEDVAESSSDEEIVLVDAGIKIEKQADGSIKYI